MKNCLATIRAPWAIAARDIETIASALNVRADSPLLPQARLPGERGSTCDVDHYRGVAVVTIRGVLLKDVSLLTEIFESTTYRDIVDTFKGLAIDETVKAVVARIDSPGGSTRGVADAAAAIAECAKAKPTTAFCEDQTTSAGYWLASQCSRIIVNSNCIIGSLGTYTTLVDSSVAHESHGLKVHLIRSGPLKGSGQPGVEISNDELDEYQRWVNRLTDVFMQAVAAGRRKKVSEIKPLFSGAVWIGSDAVPAGLADAVGTIDATVAILGNQTGAFRDYDARVSAERTNSEAKEERARQAAIRAAEVEGMSDFEACREWARRVDIARRNGRTAQQVQAEFPELHQRYESRRHRLDPSQTAKIHEILNSN